MTTARIILAVLFLAVAGVWLCMLYASWQRPIYWWVVGRQPSYGLSFFNGGASYAVGTALDGGTAAGLAASLPPSTQAAFWDEWSRLPARFPYRMRLGPGQGGVMVVGPRPTQPGSRAFSINLQRQGRTTTWLIPTLSGAAGIVLLGWPHWKRIGRRRAGMCRRCGYDLRATPDRCPECGTVPDRPPVVRGGAAG